MMGFSNQDASFIIGCVAWQAGIRLLKKDVSKGLQKDINPQALSPRILSGLTTKNGV